MDGHQLRLALPPALAGGGRKALCCTTPATSAIRRESHARQSVSHVDTARSGQAARASGSGVFARVFADRRPRSYGPPETAERRD